jgi:hypothetical protein
MPNNQRHAYVSFWIKRTLNERDKHNGIIINCAMIEPPNSEGIQEWLKVFPSAKIEIWDNRINPNKHQTEYISTTINFIIANRNNYIGSQYSNFCLNLIDIVIN